MTEIPLWFLLLSLFFPRISLLISYYNDVIPAHGFHSFFGGFLFSLFLPRILILIMIATCIGYGAWFWVHALVATLAYLQTSLEFVKTENKHK